VLPFPVKVGATLVRFMFDVARVNVKLVPEKLSPALEDRYMVMLPRIILLATEPEETIDPKVIIPLVGVVKVPPVTFTVVHVKSNEFVEKEPAVMFNVENEVILDWTNLAVIPEPPKLQTRQSAF